MKQPFFLAIFGNFWGRESSPALTMTHRGRCWPDLILASSALSLILFTSIYNGQCPLCMHASTKQLPIDIGQLISNYFDLHLYEFPDLTALSQAYPRWLLTECADQKLSINILQHIFCTTPLHGKRNLRTKTSWDFFSWPWSPFSKFCPVGACVTGWQQNCWR